MGDKPNIIDKEKYSEKNKEDALARKVIIDLEKKPKALPIKDTGTYVQNEFGEFTPNPAGVADDEIFPF